MMRPDGFLAGAARTRFALLGALLFGAPAAAPAACAPSEAWHLELELLSCRPAEIAISERIAGVDLPWLRAYLDNVAYGNPGVVIRGRVLRSRALDAGATILPWEGGGDVEEELFFTSSDADFCGNLEGLERLRLIREQPCCEQIPPPNVACVLDVAEARLVPEVAPAFEAEP